MRKKSLVVSIIGYGSQGRAIALNLRDSGYRVVIGLRPKSKFRAVARKDGFREVLSISDATKKGDIVTFAFPDHQHGRIYKAEIEPVMRSKKGATLLFLHGMSVHFKFVKPPKDADVILLAPHAPGVAVREQYLGKRDVSAFYAVHQNKSKKAEQTLFALADAIGIAKKRLVKTTFATEAIGDLFGEQAVLCGGMASLIKNGFDVLVESGIPPENAYLEVAYQLDLIIKLIKQYGIEGMFARISVAARYGSLLTGPKLIDKSVKKRMKAVLADITSGQFPNKLNKLSDADVRRIAKALSSLSSPKLEKAARKFAPK